MSNWTYKIPDLHAAPKALFEFGGKGSLTSLSENEAKFCVGIYCEESSHEGEPWFLGCLRPDWDGYQRTEELNWTLRNSYPTGDGHLIQLRTADKFQLVTSKGVAPDIYAPGAHIRYPLECGQCGFAVRYKLETYQHAALILTAAGFREVSIKGLKTTVDELRTSTGSK